MSGDYYAARVQAQGRCSRCGKDRGEDGTKWLCAPCNALKRLTEAERRRRLVSQGKCQWCGKTRTGGGTNLLCLPCAEKNRKQALDWYHRKHGQRAENAAAVS